MLNILTLLFLFFTEESVLQAIAKLSEDVASLRVEIAHARKDTKLVSSKVDFEAMNLERLCRYILPGETVVKRPHNLPSLPVEEIEDLDALEKFLSNDVNLSASVSSMFLHLITHFIFS